MNAQKQSEKVLHVCEEWRTNTRKREKGTSLGKWHGLHELKKMQYHVVERQENCWDKLQLIFTSSMYDFCCF